MTRPRLCVMTLAIGLRLFPNVSSWAGSTDFPRWVDCVIGRCFLSQRYCPACMPNVTSPCGVLLIARIVFATLLTLDTGALLAWAYSRLLSNVAYWSALLFVPLAVVAVRG